MEEDEINSALQEIETTQNEIVEKKKEEVAIPQKQEFSIDDITALAMNSYKDIAQHSEEIYDAFYSNVALRIDRSDVSKQMLTDSQRLKIESIQALASLANAKARLVQAQNKASGNVGVFVNTKNAEDVGINLQNLVEE